MQVDTDTQRKELAELVGEQYLRPATLTDAIEGVQAQWVVAPADGQEIARVLRWANEHNLHVAPVGGGTKLAWGSKPQALDLLVSTHRLNNVLEHTWADMTATVQAGCSVAKFQRVLATHQQRLALDPLWEDTATIGGILATNDSGLLRTRFGALRDLLLGVTIALPDGTLAKSGGKVVKNVAGYDLPKLMIGAFGTLGVIVEATFRLYALPGYARTLTFTVPTFAVLDQSVYTLFNSTLAPTAIQIRAATDTYPQIDVQFEGLSGAVDAQINRCIHLLPNGQQVNTPEDVGHVRQQLWQSGLTASSLIGKISNLPAVPGQLCTILQRLNKAHHLTWQLVMQGYGVGLVRLDAENDETLVSVLSVLRAELAKQEGALVVLDAAQQIKERVGVWGDVGDVLPLMKRVKEQFDERQVLNPGRFVGGI